jgi:glutaconate CoA-transferase subunit A
VSEEDKLMTMREAIKKYVHDGDTIFIGGFIHNEPFAAIHEIIRQRKRDLTITKSAGTIGIDQMVGAGCVSKLIISYLWNPIGPRPAHAFRRAVEMGIPRSVEVEDYSVLTLTMAYFAGALGLPFMPTRSLMGSDIANKPSFMGEKKLKMMVCPFTGEKLYLIPSITPDVGIIQVQRADKHGNAQVWGLMGDSKYGINACKRVIVCAEEIVDEAVIRADPNKTIIPGFRVNAVVHEPWGAHPSYMQGYYDIDVDHFLKYEEMSRTLDGFENYLKEWVFGVEDRKEYLNKLGPEKLLKLKIKRYYA